MRGRAIGWIVIHCSVRPSDGFHFYIHRSGRVVALCALECAGEHTQGYDENSIGIGYEGGVDGKGRPADTRTEHQRDAMAALLIELLDRYPGVRVVGHRDLNPEVVCPCFEVEGGEL